MAAPETLGCAAAPELSRSGWRRWLGLGILGVAGTWALLRFGATASEDLYFTFLLASASLGAALAFLSRGRLPVAEGWLWALVLAGLCWQLTRLPTFEARGFVRPALGVVAVVLVSVSLGRDLRGLRRVAWAVVASGVFEATWGIIEVLRALAEGAGPLPPARGSLLNPNHFASWLNACLALGLGLASGSRYLAAPEARRDRWGEGLERSGRAFAAAWMILAVALSGSRAGLAVTVLLISGFLLCRELNERKERAERGEWVDRRGRWGTVAGVATLVVALGFALLGPIMAGEELMGLERRIELYRSTLELVADSPWVGSGPGLFAWTFRPYHRFDTHKRFRHAHNDFLETATDWGIPMALLVLGLLGWRLARSWRQFLDPEGPGAQRWLQWGTAAALATFLVHGLVDFSLQIPSHLLLFATILGLARAAELPPQNPPGVRGARLEAAVRVVLGLVALAAASRVAERWWALEQVRGDDSLPALERAIEIDPRAPSLHFRLGARLRDDPEHRDLKRSHEYLSRAVELNPLSWRYRYELGAFYEGVAQEDRAAESLFEGLALDPHNPAAKQRVAAFFLRRNRPQEALTLLAQAVSGDPELLDASGEMLLRSSVPLEEIVAWWPQDGSGPAVLLRLFLRLKPEGGEPWLDSVWSQWLERERPSVEEGSFWIEHLLAEGRDDEARRRWYELLGAPQPELGRVWNGDFERPLSEGVLGWQTSRTPSMSWTRPAGEGVGGSAALRIDLQGTPKGGLRRLRQLVVVRPGTIYELRYALRTEGLDPESTSLQVVSDGTRRPLKKVPAEPGAAAAPFSAGWIYRVERLLVPEAVDRVWIRLAVRFPSSGAPLSGTLWLDDISFESRARP